jgi:hypothetical protein
MQDLAPGDDEVEAGAVAPGFGDGEAVGCGAGHEVELDPFAALLGVFDERHAISGPVSSGW